ncbi:MAG: bacillithiol transferase BstA [Ferruginibacter sp.]
MNEDLKYPIGKYQVQPYSEKQFQDWLIDIKNLPQHLENAVLNLDAAQLDVPYREGGWMIKQVVHHVADSHMNAYIRFKLGLTEENPSIRPYDEVAWAELKDSLEQPINVSITLLHALHSRWNFILKDLTEEQLTKRTVFHPEHKREMTLWFLFGLYAWHGRHHVAHIISLRDRMKWG